VSGYLHCACRDCFEIVCGDPGDFCDDCETAGCPGYQGVDGLSQECQRDDAYGCDCSDDDCDDDTNDEEPSS
jgi:hypothetical protein